MVGTELVHKAIGVVAREHKFHPIRDYLDGLEWDGEERIDYWAATHLGVDPGPDAAANASAKIAYVFGARFLISAVARAYDPGCQVDTVLILEGEQGKLKSTALRVLAGKWFTDTLPDIRNKDAAIQLLGIWITEIGELDAFKNVPSSTVKQFLTRRADRFRPPYGKLPIDVPRSCVFAGTVNLSTYLHDETGARRYWPIAIGEIDIKALERDRDQLWAEAVHRYKHGDVWYLDTPELNTLAQDEQADRYDHDPWAERITNYLVSRRDTSVAEILLTIKPDIKEWIPPDKTRIAHCLQAVGWAKYRPRDGATRSWRYRPKST
jgi:predicted P-loop ATPase